MENNTGKEVCMVCGGSKVIELKFLDKTMQGVTNCPKCTGKEVCKELLPAVVSRDTGICKRTNKICVDCNGKEVKYGLTLTEEAEMKAFIYNKGLAYGKKAGAKEQWEKMKVACKNINKYKKDYCNFPNENPITEPCTFDTCPLAVKEGL